MTALALESGYWNSLGHGVGAIALYALLGLALMIVGFYAIDLTTPGKLGELIRAGRPNATVVTAAGMLSMAFIVVLAIYASSGRLAEGLIAAAVYGLVGIFAQVLSVRVIERVTRIDIGAVLDSPGFVPEVLVVAAAHFAVGMVVAFAIL
ncbi:DUF350 domain-containing protein [Skermania piniformis]|uniref:DUF350 domain-containing protein n=1 Tax=Skermania pinensis TaxID=39122 RepID=A0ABX8S4F8_9ACTN|nr:DUF350 domain-containing protein [Skermania piniformis]QXQ12712.1 DUF350 domain-containing protein [Skermania piniformis]